MSVENGEWIMRGISSDDPACIHSAEELEAYVDEAGFLPLFAGEVPGFSAEEHTDPDSWWSDDAEKDPWVWREIIARRGHVAYGKFFNGRAGFISRKWIPVFANYRRDGYDFDARWDDEKASFRQKKIMDLFAGEMQDRELFSFEAKAEAGFGKSGEKNFEGTLTGLEMEFYLVCADFRQRTNKKGESYGWHIAVLATPEHVFGEELVRSGYAEDPKDSLKKIKDRVKELFPEAEEQAILKLVAYSEDRPAAKKTLPYPRNLLKAIDKDKDPWSWSDDQISGLYVALGQLRPKQQRVLFEKYHDGMNNEEIGARLHRAAGTIGTYHGKAMKRLRSPLIATWYLDGYAYNLKACALSERWDIRLPEAGETITDEDLAVRLGIKVSVYENMMLHGIVTVGDLKDAMGTSENWYKDIRSVGAKTAEDIAGKMGYFGM